MSFLNLMLLGGSLAFTVPLWIHLLHRSKYQPVPWAAMHLLESALQAQARRFHWQSLLLLLVRCLIPVLLALCLARPVLTRYQVPGAQGPPALAIVLDNSLSMGLPDKDANLPFHRAQQQIWELVDAFRNAEMSLHPTGLANADASDATLDRTRFLSSLAVQAPVAGANDLRGTLQSALETLQESQQSARQLVVVSDFVAADWKQLTAADMQFLQRLAQQAPFPTQLTLLSVTPQNPNTDNLAIAWEDPHDFRVLPGEVKELRVAVTNHGPTAHEDVPVHFRLQDVALPTQVLDIAAGETRRLACRFVLEEGGWYALSAQFEQPVGLAADDQALHLLQVQAPQEILLLTSQQSPAAEHPTSYLALALAPYVASQSARNRFTVSTRSTSAFRPRQHLEQAAVVILADVPRLGERPAQALVEFVRDGGGLIVLGSQALDANWYRREFVERAALLPREFGARRSPRGGLGFLRGPSALPELQVFEQAAAGDLYDVTVRSWFELKPPGATVQAPAEERVGIMLQDGSPWLVARRFGRGRVVQCASGCGSNDSNLPLKPVFVPLMQQLVQAATASGYPPNALAGQPAMLQVAAEYPLESLVLQATPSQHIDQLTKPSVLPERAYAFPLPVRDPTLAVDFESVGVRDLSLQQLQPTAAEQRATIEPPLINVLPHADESTTEHLSEVELQRVAEALGASRASSVAEFQHQAATRKHGRELWRWFLLGLLALLFAEILLASTVTRGTA